MIINKYVKFISLHFAEFLNSNFIPAKLIII